MHHPILTRAFTASAAVAPRRLVKLTGDGEVAPATAARDAVIGVSAEVAGAKGRPRRCAPRRDRHGRSQCSHRARCALVTAAADGKAVATSTAGNAAIGRALVAATAAGDLIPVLLAPSQL